MGFQRSICSPSCPQTDHWEEMGPILASRVTAALKHSGIVGQVQQGRSSLDLGARTSAWNKASVYQRCKLVADEIQQQEKATTCAKVVAQAKQGQWVNWEGVEKRKSPGKNCGRWRHSGQALSSRLPMMSFHPPKISTSGTEKIAHATSART